jgi:hypothetical protein
LPVAVIGKVAGDCAPGCVRVVGAWEATCAPAEATARRRIPQTETEYFMGDLWIEKKKRREVGAPSSSAQVN